jgi:hypothetical protein
MAKQAYVYSGTDWVPLASEVTNLSGYQTKASNQFANRNLIINGDMQIAQRSSSVASITAGGYNTADRWRTLLNTQGTWTQSVENDAPTGSGFRKSLKMLCTTADASPAAGDYVAIDSLFEGQNLQHIKKGTSASEQLTVSFWVKANVTGTYIFNISDQDNNRQVSKSYTINASGTWEYKTITFPADTTGALDNDNARSLDIRFWLGAGSNSTSGTLATTWQSYTEANTAVGQTNVAAAISNYWQVTGVQLEVGDTATPFEFKSFAQDLVECQRYYQVLASGSGTMIGSGAFYLYSNEIDVPLQFMSTMRAAPTAYVGTGTDYYYMEATGADYFNNLTMQRAGTTGANFYNTGQAAGTQFRPGLITLNNAAAYIAVDAEL